MLFEYCQDPSGYFYYDDLDKAKAATKYVSDKAENPKGHKHIAWVKFYKDNTLVAEVCHVFFEENTLINGVLCKITSSLAMTTYGLFCIANYNFLIWSPHTSSTLSR